MKTDAEIENNNHSVVSNFHSTVIKSTSRLFIAIIFSK